MEKIAILEGEVKYNDDNSQVDLSVRVIGTKGKAKMSVIANRINDNWEYEKISIRIKNPSDKLQTIKIR